MIVYDKVASFHVPCDMQTSTNESREAVNDIKLYC